MSKGQITLPKEIRDQLHLKTGSKIAFLTDSSGQVVLEPLMDNFESLRGMVKSNRKKPLSIEETNEAIARGYSGT